MSRPNGVAPIPADGRSESDQVERTVLGALLMGATPPKGLEPEDFADGFNRMLADVIWAMHTAGVPVSQITVPDWISENRTVLFSAYRDRLMTVMFDLCNGAPEVGPMLDYYATIVVKHSTARTLHAAGRRIAAAAASGDVTEAIEVANREQSTISKASNRWRLTEKRRTAASTPR